ncbi:unnamed protein product [Rotaria sp. Silwood1]|nr:unnamed protein product [Rotaria sp. Silwood1]
MFLSLHFVNTIIPLSNEQLLIINKGLKFISPCQSRFFYRQPMEKIIEQEYNRLYAENCKSLTNYTFLTNDIRATEFFSEVKHVLEQLYTKPLPKKLERNARYIYKMIKSMRRKLRKANIAIGQTDKKITGGICPLADNLHLVILLLDHLLERNEITNEQNKQMYPNL